MTEKIEKIDLETWDRGYIFRNYLGMDFPYINIGCEMDVTNLYRFVKEQGISFNFAMVYASLKIADESENFHYRILDGEPVRVEKNHALVTHLQKGSDLFVNVDCMDAGDMVTFAKNNRKHADDPVENGNFAAVKGRLDIISYTSIPWISFTHFFRTISKFGADSAPRLAFGKFQKKDGRIMMPFSSQTHHGLMDGVHVGRYYQHLQEYLDDEGWKEEL